MNLELSFLISFNVLTKNYKSTFCITNNYLACARLVLIFDHYIRSFILSCVPSLSQCTDNIQSPRLWLISYILSKHSNDPKPLQEYTKNCDVWISLKQMYILQMGLHNQETTFCHCWSCHCNRNILAMYVTFGRRTWKVDTDETSSYQDFKIVEYVMFAG